MTVNESMAIVKLEDVRQQIVYAHLFLRFSEIIKQNIIERNLEPNLFFWDQCQASFYQCAVLKLAIVFDADEVRGKNLGIYKLLRIFESNYERTWKKSNKLNLEQLKKDEELVKYSDKSVKKLIDYRNALIAHTDNRLIGGTISLVALEASNFNIESPASLGEVVKKRQNLIINKGSETNVLSLEELYRLVDRGLEICNRYAILLDLVKVEKFSEETINKNLSFINLLSGNNQASE